jgi:CubicO group peptidase (beta-lactamase class C family)
MKLKYNFLFIFILIFILVDAAAQNKVNIKKIDEINKKAFETFEPVGLSVAIIKDGKIIYKNAFGTKNSATGEKLTTSSLFNIASCSKAFTAACLALLVEDGKIKWSDKVVDYIPEFRLADPYITKELNMEDILSHRTGFGTFDGDLLWYSTDYEDIEVIQRMKYLPTKYDFRSRYGYQNNMYLIAGEIIKRVTGQTWSEFLQARLLTQLDMKETRPSADELDKQKQNIAWPHIHGNKVDIVAFKAAKPAGAMFSSVEELANWTIMLMNGGQFNGRQILKQESINNLMEVKTNLGVNDFLKSNGTNFHAYGLGWKLFDYHGKKIVEHNGGMPGYISKVCVVPSENMAIIILNNGEEGFINEAIRYKVLDMFLSSEEKDWVKTYKDRKNNSLAAEKKKSDARAASRITGTKPSVIADKFTGIFNDNSYGQVEVTLKEGNLNLTFLPAKEVFTSTMEHWHHNTFKVKFKDEFLDYGLVTFDFDANQEITGFKIDLPSWDFHFNELYFKKVNSGLLADKK